MVEDLDQERHRQWGTRKDGQETSTTGFWFHASVLAVLGKADEAERRQRNEEERCSRDLHRDSKGSPQHSP